MFRLLPLIVHNVVRNRRRSLLTLGSVAVSLAIVGVMVALYLGFFMPEQSSPSEARRLIVRHKVSLTQSLPIAYRQRIAQVPGVEGISAWQWFGGIYRDNRDPRNFFAQFGVEPEQILVVRPDLTLPEDQRQAFIRQRTAAVVTRALAERMNWQVGQRISLTSEIFNLTLEFDLVGIMDAPNTDRFMLFNREYLAESFASSARNGGVRDLVGTFLIIIDRPERAEQVAAAIDGMFANSPFPTKTETEQQFSVAFVNFLGNVRLYLMVICAAVTFTILLVSANTMAMSVRERTRELAILRTLGYTPGEILRLVIGESVLLAVAGGLLGGLISFSVIGAVRSFGGFFEAITPRWEQWLAVLLVAVVVGVVSALVPAVSASRRNIVESLRFTG